MNSFYCFQPEVSMSALPTPFFRNVTMTVMAAAIPLFGLPHNVSAQQGITLPKFAGPIPSSPN